jgi:hypothetical protein
MGRPMPPSKHDRSLPYTYEAWIDVLDGDGTEPVWHHYFCDTLCGLIEYLAEEGLEPAKVKLYGVFQKQQTRLDTDLLTDAEGRWLTRPALCRALEEHYEHTHEECYRGHVEKDHCAFEDRDRDSLGPF